MSPAFPKLFNAYTVLTFSLPHAGEISLSIFDVTGQMVRDLAQGHYQAGAYQVSIDATGLSNGIDIARLISGGSQMSRRVTLLK